MIHSMKKIMLKVVYNSDKDFLDLLLKNKNVYLLLAFMK